MEEAVSELVKGSCNRGALVLVETERSKLFCNISMLELSLNNPEESLTAAISACAGDCLSFKAHYRRGQALVALRRYAEADEAFQTSLERPDVAYIDA